MRARMIYPLLLGTALLPACNSKTAPIQIEHKSNQTPISEVIVVGPDGKRIPTNIQQGNNPNQQIINGGNIKIELEVGEVNK